VYSVDAAWKSHPIEVTPGGYRLRTFALTELASTGTHIFVGVRWLSASGTPLSVSKVTIAADSWPSDSNFTTDWRDVGGDFAAPVGAAFAQILLGSMGDLFIGQLAFDDVSFRRI
jgi:carbohydrate-selective porin OprB